MRIARPELLERIDWWNVGAVFALSSFGLTLIHSLTWPEDSRFVRQLIFLGLGFALFIGVQFLDIHFLRNAGFFIYAGILILLLGLIIFGESTRGIRGWIMFGTFGFQTAEFAKLATILFLATTLERLQFDLAKFKHVILVMIIIGLPVVLTIMQPDLGSAFIILISGLVMVLYTGLDKKKFIVLLLTGIIIVVGAWSVVLRDYQKERVLTFFNPQSDPLGSGYNVTQSVIAIGSGGLFGRGLGLGTQSQLDFLPEQETDFIFASLAEEVGFLGTSVMLFIYLFFLWRLYLILREGQRPFANFLVLGILVMFLSQACINIGMNMGLFPVTGIPLPFISYGGSSLIVSFLGLGIAMNVRS